MEFECESMTYLGCERMDYVKELMLVNREEIICKNMCCIGCQDSNKCSYHCNRSDLPKEERLIPTRDSEEIRQEKILGIRCYRCGKEINRQGTRIGICSAEIEEAWICEECIKEMCGPGTYIERKEDLSETFKKSKIGKLKYEQLSFL